MQKISLFLISTFLNIATIENALGGNLNSCEGKNAFLAILDRPTIQDSACVVKINQVVVEAGFQIISSLSYGNGYNFPQTEIRLGLPANSEFVLVPPNYFRQNPSGFGPTILGVKHQLGYTKTSVWTIEGLFTVPSGSSVYGSAGLGTAISGIANFNLTDSFAITLMLGFSSQTLSTSNGAQRYTSINPDFVASWQPYDKFQFFAELYGQSSTGPNEGPGCNVDGGIQYLLKQNFEVDAEVGARLAGSLGGFNHYIGFGFGLMF